ncbi:invasion associated locus B family protein [Agrobacterium leguminum]|uniref:invasion associated locus B family protein n=1 Tax=Agrobacterium leguminum TaxID=2792015 RepID=UPI003CE5AB7A
MNKHARFRIAAQMMAVLLPLQGLAVQPSIASAVYGKVADLSPGILAQTSVETDGVGGSQSGAMEVLPILPQGADSLKETYGDWALECKAEQTAVKCAVGQFQYDQKNGTAAFAMEVFLARNGAIRIQVLVPFGMKLSEGIRLQLDDEPDERRLDFDTCVSDGCLTSIMLSGQDMNAMTKAQILKVSGVHYSRGQNLTFPTSLKGFSAAIARLESFRKATGF